MASQLINLPLHAAAAAAFLPRLAPVCHGGVLQNLLEVEHSRLRSLGDVQRHVGLVGGRRIGVGGVGCYQRRRRLCCSGAVITADLRGWRSHLGRCRGLRAHHQSQREANVGELPRNLPVSLLYLVPESSSYSKGN